MDLFSCRIIFVLCIPACSKEIGETLHHRGQKKRKSKSYESIVGCVNVASYSSFPFSFFLANRDIVYNIKIYDLGWYSSELFLFSTSCQFLFFLQFIFFIFFYGSSCAYFASFCAFLWSFTYIFFYPNNNYLVVIRLANLFPGKKKLIYILSDWSTRCTEIIWIQVVRLTRPSVDVPISKVKPCLLITDSWERPHMRSSLRAAVISIMISSRIDVSPG